MGDVRDPGEAEVVMDKVREARQPTRPVVDPNITVSAYSERWRATIEATVKPRTRESYAQTLRLHILPTLGLMKVRLPLARDSVRIIQLRSVPY